MKFTLDSLKNLIKQHIILVSLLLIIFLICIGLVKSTGWVYMPNMLLHVMSVIVFYFLLTWVVARFSIAEWKIILFRPLVNSRILIWLPYGLLFFFIVFMIYHFWYMGCIPGWDAFNSLDYYGIAQIRQDIMVQGNTFIYYISGMLLKAMLPFLTLYFFIKNKWAFAILLPLALFYCFALMQKGNIVSLFVPLIVYLFFTRKFLLCGVFAVAAFISVSLMLINVNPSMRASEEEIKAYMDAHRQAYVDQKVTGSLSETVSSSSTALYERVIYSTGLDVGRWFEVIPDQIPYAKGCGYRFLAPLLGCQYNDYVYEKKVWDVYYPFEYKLGFRGTVTAAYFMYDYGNFGRIGLILSGFLIASVLIALKLIFDKNFLWLASLNVLYVLWLSNAALYTLLLSGGWFLSILLFWIFRPLLEKEKC